MLISNRYPELSMFLGFFPDADLEGLTDEEAARKFCTEMDAEDRRDAMAQGRDLLENEDTAYIDAVGRYANRHFENRAAAREWLNGVLQVLADYKG